MTMTIPILTDHEYHAMIAMPEPSHITPTSTHQYLRDRCIVYLMLEAGLRCEEVSLLPVSTCYFADLPAKHLSLGAAIAKCQQPRDIPLTPNLTHALAAYQPAIPWDLTNSTPHLLVGPPTYPNGLATRTLQRIIAKWSTATIGRQIWPHVLRHTFAMRLLRSGCHIRVLQALLGHKHLSSTQKYLNPNTRDSINAIDAMSRYDPPP